MRYLKYFLLSLVLFFPMTFLWGLVENRQLSIYLFVFIGLIVVGLFAILAEGEVRSETALLRRDLEEVRKDLDALKKD